MSLVMAAISYLSRNFLHSRSISVVLPEPTGPPIPTRKGPWGFFIIDASFSTPRLRHCGTAPKRLTLVSRPKQPRVLRLVASAGEVGAESGRPDVIELDDQRTLRSRSHV